MDIGYIHFDTPGATNYVSEVLTLSERANLATLNKYVLVKESSESSGPTSEAKSFVGRIVEGPFFSPEEVGRSSAMAQAPILRGDQIPILPKYYALERLEILGEFAQGRLEPTRTRPRPKSVVSEMPPDHVRQIIGSKGDLLLGKLDGYDQVQIHLNSDDKKILPRNIGIFGTVGSGKSNTAQVVIEEALKKGYAVVLFDVEGEYVSMDKPTRELRDSLGKFNMTPSGVKDLVVYYPVGADRPRTDSKSFCVRFGTFDPYILFELVHATEAQERSFSVFVDELEREKESRPSKTGPLTRQRKAVDPLTLSKAIQKIWGLIDEQRINKASGMALAGKLGYVNRLRIFDQEGIDDIEAEGLAKPGRLSVIDVSSCSDPIKNIVIVDILKKIFDLKVETKEAPRTLIVIEEAHTFISREARDKMEATIDMLKVIARRGRKRWLCLCFVSQQPDHIPNEIFELCNTRLVHTVKSEANLLALKNTTGGVMSQVWNLVPNLGQGQVLAISPQFTHPVIVNVRPAASERQLVD